LEEDDSENALQTTVELLSEGRYDEASTILDVIRVAAPNVVQGNRNDRLTSVKAVMSLKAPADPKSKALALRPLASIGQAISLIQNRQSKAALRKNTELELYEKYYVDAMAFFNIRDYDEAIKNLELALSHAETESDIIKAIVTKALVQLVSDSPYSALSTVTEQSFYDQNQQLIRKRLLDLQKNLIDPLSLFIISYIFFNCKIVEKAKEYLSESITAGIGGRYENYLKGLIYLEEKKPNWNKALSCFEIAIGFDPNFADAHNGIAVVLAEKGKLPEALDAIRRTLAIDPTNVTAHENLIKLTVNIEKKNQTNFWDFWNSSGWKRGTAIFLSILAIGLVFYGIFLTEIPLPPVTTILMNETTTDGTLTSITITNSTNISKGQPSTAKILQELPNSYLILVGIIVVIILIPQIKSAKLGEIEIEMLTPETPTTDTTLKLSDTFLWQLDKQLQTRASRLK